jgi:hypothetical protein
MISLSDQSKIAATTPTITATTSQAIFDRKAPNLLALFVGAVSVLVELDVNPIDDEVLDPY